MAQFYSKAEVGRNVTSNRMFEGTNKDSSSIERCFCMRYLYKSDPQFRVRCRLARHIVTISNSSRTVLFSAYKASFDIDTHSKKSAPPRRVACSLPSFYLFPLLRFPVQLCLAKFALQRRRVEAQHHRRGLVPRLHREHL